MKFGYFTDIYKDKLFMAKKDHKLVRYLEGVFPYHVNKVFHASTQVLIITPVLEDRETPITLDELSEPILLTPDKSGERVWFLPPKTYNNIADYAKDGVTNFINVKTNQNKEISIMPFTNCPRLVDFSTGGLGDYSTEYGKFTDKIYNMCLEGRESEITYGELADLIFYAVSSCYNITRDVFSWINQQDHIISDADHNLLFDAIMGCDSKKSSGAKAEE